MDIIIRKYFHRVLLITAYISIAIFLLGLFGPFLSTVFLLSEIFVGVSIVGPLRGIIAESSNKDLIHYCFTFGMLDGLLYRGNFGFKSNFRINFEPLRRLWIQK